MELGLKGRTAVITGGGTGIGKQTALEFAREGVNVCIVGRREEPLKKTCEDACMNGFSVMYHVADVRDEDAMKSCINKVSEQFGGLDIWINNAGIAISKPFFEFTRENWADVIDINLTATFFCTQLAAAYMKGHGGGVIMNASSYAVKIPHAGGSIYAAAKSGVSSLTKTLAAELAPHHIRVIGYIPGMIATEISYHTIEKRKDELVSATALRRLGEAEDLAKPLVFLASDACEYITGVDVEISGGKYCVQNTQFAYDAANHLIHGIQS